MTAPTFDLISHGDKLRKTSDLYVILIADERGKYVEELTKTIGNPHILSELDEVDQAALIEVLHILRRESRKDPKTWTQSLREAINHPNLLNHPSENLGPWKGTARDFVEAAITIPVKHESDNTYSAYQINWCLENIELSIKLCMSRSRII